MTSKFVSALQKFISPNMSENIMKPNAAYKVKIFNKMQKDAKSLEIYDLFVNNFNFLNKIKLTRIFPFILDPNI